MISNDTEIIMSSQQKDLLGDSGIGNVNDNVIDDDDHDDIECSIRRS